MCVELPVQLKLSVAQKLNVVQTLYQLEVVLSIFEREESGVNGYEDSEIYQTKKSNSSRHIGMQNG
ncbi:hypothetical protein [Pseudomonas fluorescens]|uniref:hypothetical protein n=1 Tax=Pseudomonas fluorescens TaxID=294 RepID=UPI0012425854|nr:hypothetical protein [Pseudomonas fluorescens]